MKTLKLTIFLSIWLLLLHSCDSNNYNGGNYQEHTNSHDYSSQDSSPNGGLQNEVNQAPFKTETSSVREVWQKPMVVMNKMGDLKDKVVADIGAGYGFFTLQIAENSEVKKVIAIDIDDEAIQFIENQKITFRKSIRDRIESRLADEDDPKLKSEEADVVLIVDTYYYFKDPVAYLKNLMKGISTDGELMIIEFKKRNTPEGPPIKFRTAVGKLEQDLEKAGYINIESDDQTLDYQYIITAQPGGRMKN